MQISQGECIVQYLARLLFHVENFDLNPLICFVIIEEPVRAKLVRTVSHKRFQYPVHVCFNPVLLSLGSFHKEDCSIVELNLFKVNE